MTLTFAPTCYEIKKLRRALMEIALMEGNPKTKGAIAEIALGRGWRDLALAKAIGSQMQPWVSTNDRIDESIALHPSSKE